jgi:hypothetical protein
VSVTGVTNGASYLLGAVPAAGCSTSDNASGVAVLATASISGGTANHVGAFTATCSGGKDNAGNTAPAVSVTYKVSYVFKGFFPPFTGGVFGPFKAGSTIPVIWQLKSASGSFVGSLSAITAIQFARNLDCSGAAEGTPIEADAPGHSGLIYDRFLNVYDFNWKTPRDASGCYTVQVVLDDGTSHGSIVRLK